jgi:hypothetical protein
MGFLSFAVAAVRPATELSDIIESILKKQHIMLLG